MREKLGDEVQKGGPYGMKSPCRAEEHKDLFMCKGVLLDLGGTLIYGPGIKEGFAKSLQNEGLDLKVDEKIKRKLILAFNRTYDELKEIKRKLLIEVSLHTTVKIALDRVLKANGKLIEKLKDQLLKLYVETRSTYDDVHFFLKKMKALGYKVMIVSNVPDHYMALGSLERLRLIDYVDDILTSAYLGIRKPHPLIYITAMKRLGTSKVVFIGNDVESDVLGPLSVGIPVIHIARDGVRLKRSLSSLYNVLDIILT